MSMFKPATKDAAKARIALCGPSGSGKTYTALTLAHALAEKVAVVDTERGSASKYVGLNGWAWDTVEPDKFSPLSLVGVLAEASDGGYGCVVVDSLSHYWMGTDGMLEQVDRRSGPNKFTSGWKAVGPEEKRMIDALIAYPGHVIVTMRVKTEYVIEENDRGKKEPKKVGLKPVQRDGIEFEMDLVGDLDQDNTFTVTKSRIPALSKAVIPSPGIELAQQVAEWLGQGEAVPTALEYRDRAIACSGVDELRGLYREVESHRLLGAPLLADGKPTILGEFIKDLANAEAR